MNAGRPTRRRAGACRRRDLEDGIVVHLDPC